MAAFKTSSPVSARASTILPSFTTKRNLSMILPLSTRGMEAYTTPLIPVRRGEVNSSSVGILATNSRPERVTSSPASQMWPSGSSTVRSVPRELV